MGDRFDGMLLAVAFHGAVFTAGNFGLLRKADYGIDASNGTADVDLVAAPAPEASAPSARVQATVTAMTAHPDPEDIPEPVKTQAPMAPLPASPNALSHTSNLSGPLGDGSSAVPGKDATTVHHEGSSGAYFKPGYARNPPPPYPPEARKQKQEGRVVLEVLVTPEGKAGSVSLKQSSGFPLLDEAAMRSVEHWKFRPARLAGVAVETTVEIPIRFQLK